MKFNLNQLCTYEPHLSPFENLKFGNYREIEEELSDSSWKFTHDLTLAISTISDSSKLCKNKVISTYSLQSAIGILLLGSKGETREQILDNVFPSFPGTGSNKRNIHPHNAQQLLAARIDAGLMGKDNQFNVANRLYIQKKYEIISQFKNDTGSCYAANATNVDFSVPNTRDEINEWVKEKTNDKITELLPGGSLGDDTRAVLVNALHFLGSWEYTFSANLTKKANFTLPNYCAEGNSSKNESSHVEVDMISQYGNFTTCKPEGIDARVLQINYSGNELSMVIILPNNENGLIDVEMKMHTFDYQACMKGKMTEELRIYIPKFEIESDFELKKPLSEMGIKEVFNEEADLSGISLEKPLFLDEIYHSAFIKVSEEGTEAAAATGIVLNTKSRPKTFRCDHPFYFMIVENEFGTVLFDGTVINPAQ